MQDHNLKLSVVIPCYNDGQYLTESVESVTTHPKFGDCIDIVIVNDGSDDSYTLRVLEEIELTNKGNILVINQKNKGLGAARNAGIKKCKSEVVIMLDSDNKLTKRYLDLGLEMANTNNICYQNVDVIYGKPIFFGVENNGRYWETGKFNKVKLFQGNFIDACAIIKKSLWEKISGFDEHMPLQGFEDWDFWIRAAGADAKFHFVNEGMFQYRVRNNSMITLASEKSNSEIIRNYIYSKNISVIFAELKRLNIVENTYKNDRENPFRTFLKYLAYKYVPRFKSKITF